MSLDKSWFAPFGPVFGSSKSAVPPIYLIVRKGVQQQLREGKAFINVLIAERAGMRLRVTNLERTLVDVLDRPGLSGSWEEIWRSLESVEFFDLDKVVEYALLLGNATTAAKVGFFLEQHRETLMVEDPTSRRSRFCGPGNLITWTGPSGHPASSCRHGTWWSPAKCSDNVQYFSHNCVQ